MADSSDTSLLIAKRTFAAGTVLCRQGQISSEIYLLLQGTINVEVDEKIVQVIDTRGGFIGELSALFHQPSSATFTTYIQCECIVIPVAYLEELIVNSSQEGVNLLGILAGHLLKKAESLPGLNIDLKDLNLGDDRLSKAPVKRDAAEGERDLIIIAAEDRYSKFLDYHFAPMGFKVSFTNDPNSVTNNLEQLDPDIIIFSCKDFPRHWKPMLNILREKRSIEEAIFILITDDSFPFNEAAKAAFLQINGIISENLREKSVMFQLNDLIRRYKNLNDQRKFTRIVPNNYEQFKLVFTHPQQRYLVSGIISDISIEGSNFIPNNPSLTSDLTVNQKIPSCSLRVGEEIITVSCRIARKNRELGIEFESFEQEGHQKLFKYLMERPERDMKHHRRRDS